MRSKSGVVRYRIAPNSFVAAALGDEPALDEPGDDAVDVDAADARDLRARHRPEVRDDRERLERSLRQPALGRLLEQPRTRGRRSCRRAERPPAGDMLEHDPAALLREPLLEDRERLLDLRRIRLGGGRKLGDGQRLGCDDEQRLERPCELERGRGVGGD